MGRINVASAIFEGPSGPNKHVLVFHFGSFAMSMSHLKLGLDAYNALYFWGSSVCAIANHASLIWFVDMCKY